MQWKTHNQLVVQCRKCPRLVDFREEVARTKRRAYSNEIYWGKPVPAFGDEHANIIIVGLAPGAHGSNRTGRMFTGDASGDFLYPSLYRAGFANMPVVKNRNDGLVLKNIMISAICRCAPPDNKPTKSEINNCLPYLWEEIEMVNPKGFVALGRLAFDNLCQIYEKKYGLMVDKTIKFLHGSFYKFAEKMPWLMASYHPSRQNTQTGKLTNKMFDQIWEKVRKEVYK